MTTTVQTPDELLSMEGTELGPTEWRSIEQGRIAQFADATDDHQWIHLDAERAEEESPFGGTIAHGFLTLSMLVPLAEELLEVEQASSAINYGLDKVRFTAPVPSGANVRMRATIGEAKEVTGGVQIALDCTVEVEGEERPAVVARWLCRHMA